MLDAINRSGARYPWLSVAPVLRRAGVATANVETAVSTRGASVPKEYTFLGYLDVRPAGFDATATRSGAAPAFPELIRPDVRAAKRRADLVVVWFHWGIERTFSPTARQRSLARTSFEAGADVVLGAHPHVLQPIRRTRANLVAWSLGNFVFGANSRRTSRTGILRMKLTRAGVVDHSFRRARIGGELRVQPRLLR